MCPVTSRPRICWSDLAGATVGIWGLGVEGGANLRKLRAVGGSPVIADDRPATDEVDGVPVLSTAAGGWDALARCQVVVKTPGISRYRPDVAALGDRGIPVVGGLGLWLEEADRDRVVCITGTKGKSTTTAIAAHLLQGLGHLCLAAGNIGRLPYDPDLQEDPEFTVVEVSSFQATDLSCAPPVVAVTSLAPDHLDWHGSVERYYADKLSLCTQPGARLTVANGDSAELRAEAVQLGPKVEWVEDRPEAWTEGLALVGAHNRRNALIARAVLSALGVPGAEDEEALAAAATGFEALGSRLTEIGTRRGVTFVDDSLSTNALSAIAALDAFPGRPVALIVGGADRGIDYAPLARRVLGREEPTLVVTLPASGRRIHEAIDDEARSANSPVRDTGDLDSAVSAAFAWASPGSVILLSPAAASFGQFADYQDRAAAFRRAMEALPT
jgi:UDP-N-acetylmuramoyl-L-alanine---L-glutamate ligase